MGTRDSELPTLNRETGIASGQLAANILQFEGVCVWVCVGVCVCESVSVSVSVSVCV